MRNLRSGARERATSFQDCGVLDGAGNDVSGLAAGADCADERKIIGLGSTGGEDDFVRLGTNERGDLGSRSFDGLSGDRPSRWRLEGLPKAPPRDDAIASRTRGSSGVVAE